MDYNNLMNMNNVDFGDMPPQPFLLGLLSAFNNRYQACADRFFKEITWKQFFAIICINLCKEAPTINELAEIMGSSHQNVKQILLKLERKGFISLIPDDRDRRKQRIMLTKSCYEFCQRTEKQSNETIERIFSGIDKDRLSVTIQTILQMERNVSEL